MGYWRGPKQPKKKFKKIFFQAFSDFVLETAKDEKPNTSKNEEHGYAETPKR